MLTLLDSISRFFVLMFTDYLRAKRALGARFVKPFPSIRRNVSGATGTEYALIIGLIAIVVIGGAIAVGQGVGCSLGAASWAIGGENGLNGLCAQQAAEFQTQEQAASTAGAAFADVGDSEAAADANAAAVAFANGNLSAGATNLQAASRAFSTFEATAAQAELGESQADFLAGNTAAGDAARGAYVLSSGASGQASIASSITLTGPTTDSYFGALASASEAYEYEGAAQLNLPGANLGPASNGVASALTAFNTQAALDYQNQSFPNGPYQAYAVSYYAQQAGLSTGTQDFNAAQDFDAAVVFSNAASGYPSNGWR